LEQRAPRPRQYRNIGTGKSVEAAGNDDSPAAVQQESRSAISVALIARVLKKFDIGFVVNRKTRKEYVFDGLERVLPV
jgi:hypothetical protein